MSPSRASARSLKQATDGTHSKTLLISKGGSVAVSSLQAILMTSKALFIGIKSKTKKEKMNPLCAETILILCLNCYMIDEQLTTAQTGANG